MNLNTVDLNLFLVFQAIFETRSVTLAGERLALTQSAVSNALKRMRGRFSDPLFVRTAEGMVPTPLAEVLIAPIEAGLAQFSQAIDHGRTFDPETSNRLFRLAINDIGQLVMMPALLQAAQERAPHVRFETVDVSYAEARQKMLHGLIDLAIGSWEPMGQAFYQQRLFDEIFVVLMAREHPIRGEGLTFKAYLAAEHIAYSPSGATHTELEQTLQRAGVLKQRNVVLNAAHSLGLSSMVSRSHLLLTAPRRLGLAMAASRFDLRIEPAPFEITPFPIRQQWHERFHRDSGNRWLRELMFGLFHETSTPYGAAMPSKPAIAAPDHSMTDMDLPACCVH